MLGTENRRDFEHSFEYGNKRLLIKLRTLRKVNGFAEVVQLENVRAAFSSRKVNFGGVDFSKILRLQIFAESALNSFLNFKNSAFFGVAKSNGAVVKIYRKLAVNLLFGNYDGRNCGGLG